MTEATAVAVTLQRLMDDARMNPTQLSRLAGLSRTTIYAILNGGQPSPTRDTLIKLAHGLATDPKRPTATDPEAAKAYYAALVEAVGGPRVSDVIRVEDEAAITRHSDPDAGLAARVAALEQRVADLAEVKMTGRLHEAPDLDLPVFRAHAGRLELASQGSLDTFSLRSERTYIVEVTGDCLEYKGVHEGDQLVIDGSMKPLPGKIVVARIGDDTFLAEWLGGNGVARLRLSDEQMIETVYADLVILGVAFRKLTPI